MNPQRKLEYLTGLLMGFVLGFVLDGLVVLLIRIGQWFGLPRLAITWWMLLPLPLISGFFMSKAIAGLHLEDY